MWATVLKGNVIFRISSISELSLVLGRHYSFHIRLQIFKVIYKFYTLQLHNGECLMQLAMPMVCSVYGLVMLLFNWFILLQKKVLAALEDAGIFTSGGLIKDKVKVILFLL